MGIGFKTPEEFFLGSPPREWQRDFDPHTFRAESSREPFSFEAKNKLEIVLLCGSPGSGKSTMYHSTLEPLGYARVNQDMLKTRDKCVAAATGYLREGKCVAVDNTNADPQTRGVWVALAGKMQVPIRCLVLSTPLDACKHNDTVRALHRGHVDLNPERRDMLPFVAFTGFRSRFREPEVAEGFQEIVSVPFVFCGSDELWALWSKYWT